MLVSFTDWSRQRPFMQLTMVRRPISTEVWRPNPSTDHHWWDSTP
jgi:hypothetical protein